MNIIDELKQKYSCSSEDVFSITRPIAHQCDKITQYKNEYARMFKDLNNISRNSRRYDDAKEVISDMESAYWGLNEDSFEEFRDAIEQVRAWGQEWKDLCKKIVNENPEVCKDYIGIE